jgi:hypothetical protein
MRMRNAVATLAVAVLSLVAAVPLAAAAPIQVNVRIEGETETIFEGPVLTDVHRVKASSDSKWRRCDGVNVNVPLNKVPGVVPTAAGSDAMRIAGLDFDGQWYNQYEDYFLKRWGPDEQDLVESEYWGILVNNVFTDVGGCQYQLDGGDEVLWIYDAFDSRERLALYPAGYSGGAAPATATATLNQPFEVEVNTWEGYNEGTPPPAPTRTTTPYEGAEVAPVITNGQGFQKVDTASAATVLSGADGKASITFTTPGWHRIKATDVGVAEDAAIRSNRLDVCVPLAPATDCGALPADAQVRTPPPPVPGEVDDGGNGEVPGGGQPGGGGGGSGGGESRPGPGSSAPPAGPPAPQPGQVRLQRPGLDRSRLAQGLVGVSWKVLDPGPGISRWTVSSQAVGRKGAPWVKRASGASRTKATLQLPAGAAYRLRLTVVDALGRAATAALGRVQVPR